MQVILQKDVPKLGTVGDPFELDGVGAQQECA